MMNIGLALSGGGMRGLAHVGVIKALEEHGISPTHIAGTSSGGVVGALYAKGYSSSEMLYFFKSLGIFKLSKYAVRKPGFIDSEKFYEDFKRYLPEDNFSALKKKLFVTATDILKGTLHVFHEGPLIKPLLASASVPGIFTPVKIDDACYVDGGVLNNFPVELVTPLTDRTIGVYVNPFESVTVDYLKHSYNVVERAFHIKSASESLPKFKDCDLMIFPEDLSRYGMFSFKYADEIYELGYRYAMEKLNRDVVEMFSEPAVGTS